MVSSRISDIFCELGESIISVEPMDQSSELNLSCELNLSWSVWGLNSQNCRYAWYRTLHFWIVWASRFSTSMYVNIWEHRCNTILLDRRLTSIEAIHESVVYGTTEPVLLPGNLFRACCPFSARVHCGVKTIVQLVVQSEISICHVSRSHYYKQ